MVQIGLFPPIRRDISLRNNPETKQENRKVSFWRRIFDSLSNFAVPSESKYMLL